jgi:hemerythrin superfamily protein
MPTGIELIMADHRRVEALFAEIGDDPQESAVTAGRIFMELTEHDQAEAHALYPLAHLLLGDDKTVLRAELAHSEVKMVMERARAMEGAALVATLKQLRTLVERHVAEEERVILPAIEAKATPAQLDGLASRIESIKQRVG